VKKWPDINARAACSAISQSAELLFRAFSRLCGAAAVVKAAQGVKGSQASAAGCC